jgi:3-oxoacyl-[acyl-carrier protein] reductase
MQREARKLNGRVALVTGGSRGIGAAIALGLAGEGASLAIVHHDDEARASDMVARLESSGARAIALECDVSDSGSVASSMERVRAKLGPPDVLVNSAGINWGDPIEAQNVDTWQRVIGVNLTGTYLMSAACYPDMKRKGWGRILNISSQMAFIGVAGATAYCASKAGVIGLTRALAVEAAPFGVLVNSIAPGATRTEMLDGLSEDLKANILAKIPLGRFATTDEIVPIALLLASDEGSFFVGQTISPNGGDVFR